MRHCFAPTVRAARRAVSVVIGRRVVVPLWAVLLAADLAGCGRSPEVMVVPEAARKAVFQRKVDVQHRSATTPRSGRVPSKGRATSPRP
jgi:hypothetical protein